MPLDPRAELKRDCIVVYMNAGELVQQIFGSNFTDFKRNMFLDYSIKQNIHIYNQASFDMFNLNSQYAKVKGH